MIHTGDCLEVMATLEAESVDAIVTDPPYGLEFMGKEWDRLGATAEHPDDGEGPWGRTNRVRYGRSAASMQSWHHRWTEAAFRVAKPSAYLLAFGGTRTVHRLTSAIEDAGWIIRDMLVWAYASGFPKSKASLKPAWEPIVMARKPGPLRMLAIDECRIPTDDTYNYPNGPQGTHFSIGAPPDGRRAAPVESSPLGRWPANVILTDPIFDGGWDGVVGGGYQESTAVPGSWAPRGAFPIENPTPTIYGDSGTYSRFFLIPKADRTDREPVLGGLPLQEMHLSGGRVVNTSKGDGTGIRENRPRANLHPTVKPVDLMRHLVRLVTPAGGTVLDPFGGSGTTALACELEGFPWILIEKEAEYVQIAEARLNGTQRGFGLVG